VLLCDERFAQPSNLSNVSAWLRGSVANFASFESCYAAVTRFYRHRAAIENAVAYEEERPGAARAKTEPALRVVHAGRPPSCKQEQERAAPPRTASLLNLQPSKLSAFAPPSESVGPEGRELSLAERLERQGDSRTTSHQPSYGLGNSLTADQLLRDLTRGDATTSASAAAPAAAPAAKQKPEFPMRAIVPKSEPSAEERGVPIKEFLASLKANLMAPQLAEFRSVMKSFKERPDDAPQLLPERYLRLFRCSNACLCQRATCVADVLQVTHACSHAYARTQC
jgi:hypothetical protein